MKRAVTRAAVAVASSRVATRVADRALERPRQLVATAQQAGIDTLALLRVEAELAQIEVKEQVPALVRSGALVLAGLVLVGIAPALLLTAGVLWLGPAIGHAEAALLFALVGALLGVLLAWAGMAKLRQVSLVPRESLARIEGELARIGEALKAPPEPEAEPLTAAVADAAGGDAGGARRRPARIGGPDGG